MMLILTRLSVNDTARPSLAVRFTLLFVVLLLTSLCHAGPVAQSLYEWNWGKRCELASSKEVRILNRCITTGKLRNLTDLDEAAEYSIFEPIVEAESSQLSCMLSEIRFLRDSPQELNTATNESCKSLAPLAEAIKNRDKLQSLLEPLIHHIPYKDEVESNAALKVRDDQISFLQDQIGRYQAIIQNIRASDLLLGSPEVFSAVEKRLSDSRFSFFTIRASDTPEQACSYLKKYAQFYLNKDVSTLKDATSAIKEKQDSDWLHDDAFKQYLWNSGARKKVLEPASGIASIQSSTICRMEGRYGEGADLRDGLYSGALFTAGFATAGLGDLFAATAAAESTSSAAMAARVASIAYVSIQLVLGSVETYRACIDAHRPNAASAVNLCSANSPEQFRKIFYQRISEDHCKWTASALFLAGTLGLPNIAKNATKLFGSTVGQQIIDGESEARQVLLGDKNIVAQHLDPVAVQVPVPTNVQAEVPQESLKEIGANPQVTPKVENGSPGSDEITESPPQPSSNSSTPATASKLLVGARLAKTPVGKAVNANPSRVEIRGTDPVAEGTPFGPQSDEKNILYLGIANNRVDGTHHYYLVAGNKRYDGFPFFRRSRVKNYQSLPVLPTGVAFRIQLPETTFNKILKGIDANDKKLNITCLHGACRVLNSADIKIPGGDGIFIRLRPKLVGLLSGEVTADGVKLSPDDIKLISSSRDQFSHFLESTETAEREQAIALITRVSNKFGPYVLAASPLVYIIYQVIVDRKLKNSHSTVHSDADSDSDQENEGRPPN